MAAPVSKANLRRVMLGLPLGTICNSLLDVRAIRVTRASRHARRMRLRQASGRPCRDSAARSGARLFPTKAWSRHGISGPHPALGSRLDHSCHPGPTRPAPWSPDTKVDRNTACWEFRNSSPHPCSGGLGPAARHLEPVFLLPARDNGWLFSSTLPKYAP